MIRDKLLKINQFNLSKYILVCFLLFAIQVSIGGAVIYYSYLNQEEAAIDSLLDRVQRDIKFDNGIWNLSEYNADSLIPGRFRLYVFSADGFVIDRWRPVPGFMDLTDIRYLLTFQAPQTVNSVTGNDWRIYSEPIKSSNEDTLGVITVAHHLDDESTLERTDQRLVEAIEAIKTNLIIEGSTINTGNIQRRTIPFDIAFQVVDQFNQILIYNSNVNSMGRIPGFIDPSYVRREMETPQARQTKGSSTQNTYLIKSRPLTNNEQPVGVVIVASSITILYNSLKLYAVISFILSVLLTAICGVMAYVFTQKAIQKVRSSTALTESKLLSLEEISTISFLKKEGVLKINDQSISFAYATNQYYLCQALFASPKRKWETDELIEKFGEELTKNSWRKVYDSMAAINSKVATLTTVKLIIVSNKTYQLNPQLVDKIS